MNRTLWLAIFWIVEVCGALVAAAGLVLLYVSSLVWLRSGVWPPDDLQLLWHNVHSQWPHVEWDSVQRIMDSVPGFVLKLPLWIPFFMIGTCIYILGLVGVRAFSSDVRFTSESGHHSARL